MNIEDVRELLEKQRRIYSQPYPDFVALEKSGVLSRVRLRSGKLTDWYGLLLVVFPYLASATWAWWPASDTAFTKASPLAGVDARPERMSRNVMRWP